MTDLATTTAPAPAIPPDTTERTPQCTGKTKAAVDRMVWEGMKRDDAAKASGMTPKSLYNALRFAHVKAYYLSQCEVLRTSGRARRIHRLEQIAEQDDNKQAAVNAIKALDYQEDQPAAARGAASVPGLVLVIDRTGAALTAHQPSIEAKPLELKAGVSQPTDEHD